MRKGYKREKTPSNNNVSVEMLYKTYKNMLLNYALSYKSDQSKIEDAIHTLFLILIERKEFLREKRNLPAYLCVMLRRIIKENTIKENKYKLEDKFIFLEEKINNYGVREFFNENVDVNERRKKCVNYAVKRKLSKREKEVIELKFYCNLSNSQIAEELHMCNQTVRNISFRALSRIKTQLKYIY